MCVCVMFITEIYCYLSLIDFAASAHQNEIKIACSDILCVCVMLNDTKKK